MYHVLEVIRYFSYIYSFIYIQFGEVFSYISSYYYMIETQQRDILVLRKRIIQPSFNIMMEMCFESLLNTRV